MHVFASGVTRQVKDSVQLIIVKQFGSVPVSNSKLDLQLHGVFYVFEFGLIERNVSRPFKSKGFWGILSQSRLYVVNGAVRIIGRIISHTIRAVFIPQRLIRTPVVVGRHRKGGKSPAGAAETGKLCIATFQVESTQRGQAGSAGSGLIRGNMEKRNIANILFAACKGRFGQEVEVGLQFVRATRACSAHVKGSRRAAGHFADGLVAGRCRIQPVYANQTTRQKRGACGFELCGVKGYLSVASAVGIGSGTQLNLSLGRAVNQTNVPNGAAFTFCCFVSQIGIYFFRKHGVIIV